MLIVGCVHLACFLWLLYEVENAPELPWHD